MMYHSTKPDSRIISAEFQKMGDADVTFLHLRSGKNVAEVTSWLEGKDFNQHIISTNSDPEHTLVVARGHLKPDLLLKLLAEKGEAFVKEDPEKKKFNPWLWRGISSFVGQSLQIASSMRGTGSASDRAAIFGFAALNLVANVTNIVFGAQKKPDAYQLHYLKEDFNEKIRHATGGAVEPPDPTKDCHRAREETQPPESFGTKTYDTLQKYSVSGGEIGLRTLGATSLVFPITKWKQALTTLKETGSAAEAFHVAKNSNRVTFIAGLLTLLGKGVSFASKERDPFSPRRKRTTLDMLREEVTFPLSSVIEGAGAAYMTHDRFANQKIKIGGKETPDYLGGAGNAVFIGGYGIRFMAPYGSLEVDMDELYAHISDAISKAPPDKIPALVSETALELKDHFHDKPMSVADFYTKIAQDLESHHHISILATPETSHLVSTQVESTPKPEPVLHPQTLTANTNQQMALGA